MLLYFQRIRKIVLGNNNKNLFNFNQTTYLDSLLNGVKKNSAQDIETFSVYQNITKAIKQMVIMILCVCYFYHKQLRYLYSNGLA